MGAKAVSGGKKVVYWDFSFPVNRDLLKCSICFEDRRWN